MTSNRWPLWLQIFIGFIVGIIVGSVTQAINVEDANEFSRTWIEPIGKMFLKLIKMLIAPLVMSSLFVGA
ncbi:cation:dicarboxylase symporter family transporter, partial [Bacteriovoracaceae bacterium]|nr:cation:dicarboxylase symporter family transporter [Bacteriovoracaceae bacterium]